MIDRIWNLLFRCGHRRLSRPLSSAARAGKPPSRTYVVCLDCGKQFEYDTMQMRLGKAIES